MMIGYARVSMPSQNLDMQLSSLRQHGCSVVFEEVASGGRPASDRPILSRLINQLQQGDQLVVWRLDRLGRGYQELMLVADDFLNRGIKLVSITENFDITAPGGKKLFETIAAQAQSEREAIHLRVAAGLAEARAQGKTLGRPRKLDLVAKLKVKELRDDGFSNREIALELDVSETTVKRAVRKLRQENEDLVA